MSLKDMAYETNDNDQKSFINKQTTIEKKTGSKTHRERLTTRRSNNNESKDDIESKNTKESHRRVKTIV